MLAPRQHIRGEGLLEAMIAIAILVTAVLAGVALITRQLVVARDRVQETLAGGYASEALEYVDAIASTNEDMGRSWMSGIEPGSYVLKPITDTSLPRLAPKAGQDSRVNGDALSPFRRTLDIVGACADGIYDKQYADSCPEGFVSLRATVRVSWMSVGGVTKETILTRDLYAS